MAIRTADATWTGDGPHGKGDMKLGSGAFEGPFDFRSRMEHGAGTNPEELIGAAHAGCFSMQLAFMLTQAGTPPESIQTHAEVHFGPKDGGFEIAHIALTTHGRVPGIDAATFEATAEKAKVMCPVSKALAGTQITLTTKFG